ncbi:hypothetical protein BJ878DRAFT_233276 [Calycina marina]|uniref:Secreted protein n=1 Tax=Calycina marina TaxID=1763456 RepID=A0A9P8CH92_9HELO|nr:hypothetical protein BJ878DRAFT_233276 [Calycina marina]
MRKMLTILPLRASLSLSLCRYTLLCLGVQRALSEDLLAAAAVDSHSTSSLAMGEKSRSFGSVIEENVLIIDERYIHASLFKLLNELILTLQSSLPNDAQPICPLVYLLFFTQIRQRLRMFRYSKQLKLPLIVCLSLKGSCQLSSPRRSIRETTAACGQGRSQILRPFMQPEASCREIT